MKSIKTFSKGGIHPRGYKELSAEKEICAVPIPSQLIVPMSQHLGAPAEPIVEVGAVVKEGDLIGKPSGFISANIHSPADGVVEAIRDIVMPTGVKTKAVVIQTEKSASRSFEPFPDWTSLSKEELSESILKYGITGAGGAAFPTHVKVTVPKGKECKYLIINGVECEPYLCADYRLMIEKGKSIIDGIKILSKILNPEKIYIGIELNKPKAIESMQKIVEESAMGVEVVPLKVKYPQGDEKQLINAILGKEIPSGALPIDISTVVVNVGTVNAIYEAIVLKKPFIERVVTVSGKAIRNPGNFRVRIGTPIRTLIDLAGGFKETPVKLIAGGPMMGFSFFDLETPVTKGTSGILALTEGEAGAMGQTACISCGSCISVCPMGLNPTLMYRYIVKGNYAGAMQEGLADCKECGCCSYTCPAKLFLVQSMKLGKRMARKK